MRLSVKGLAIACALLWGGCILFVGVINLIRPEYGASFLRGMSSVYPWFHGSGSFGDVLIGTVEGLADGAVGGALLAWLYNLSAKSGAA
jgi:hypothetical protein